MIIIFKKLITIIQSFASWLHLLIADLIASYLPNDLKGPTSKARAWKNVINNATRKCEGMNSHIPK
jgi:hypothetical protein